MTESQLALREGQVRCGHCRTVFNGREQLISLAPPVDGDREFDELAQGPPTVTLRSARALDPPPPEDFRARSGGLRKPVCVGEEETGAVAQRTLCRTDPVAHAGARSAGAVSFPRCDRRELAEHPAAR